MAPFAPQRPTFTHSPPYGSTIYFPLVVNPRPVPLLPSLPQPSLGTSSTTSYTPPKSIHPVHTNDFDYSLPQDLIAQSPTPQRDQSRLLLLHRQSRQVQHRTFKDLLEHLNPGDTLVLNNSRVIYARLFGSKIPSGGRIEVVLIEEAARNLWWVLLRPGKRVHPGTQITFTAATIGGTPITATVQKKNAEGHCLLEFSGTTDIAESVDQLGELPLPPYIERTPGNVSDIDKERYQTVYASERGSVAAPTAGLHFTQELLEAIRAKGVSIHFITLHVGYGTFAPVKSVEIQNHVMHEERFELTQETADAINKTRERGNRVIAVGTTTVRVLETVAAQGQGPLQATRGKTRIFIYPPYTFKIVDALITNFHLPKSTLLMLVSAFASPSQSDGRDIILAAYEEAIQLRYRFFSYGDAMFIF